MKRFVRVKVRRQDGDGYAMRYGDLETDAEYKTLMRAIADGAVEDFIELTSARGIDHLIRRSEILGVQVEPFMDGRLPSAYRSD
ncbi:hypothetical protein BH23ACT10_BH23ACT10_39050 [soil metagenome]